jgi:hypothetical protein
LRSTLKAVIREITPPLLYKAAHRLRQRYIVEASGCDGKLDKDDRNQ